MLIEVVFKGERKNIYENPLQFPFKIGDYAIVEAEKGENLGVVNQLGAVLERKVNRKEPLRKILRKATSNDLERYTDNTKKEINAFNVCLRKVDEHNLNMKLVDTEYQFDGNKITFYFTAEKRVDFRELVKDLAGIYKVRIELRQIGVRDEAKRIGGYGHCGRKLCCTTFLKEFEPITTLCAKEQDLPLNPQKLSGLCGRLLCCLLYEREFYRNQKRNLPELEAWYQTPKGAAQVSCINVFEETVTVRYSDNSEQVFPKDHFVQFNKTRPPKEQKDQKSSDD
jgi:cell fate regulator YaaT (PSP1 superfamily)